MLRLAFFLIALAGLAPEAAALQKTSVPFRDSDAADWSAANTCAISYYNICTGWSWVWSGYGIGKMAAVYYERCCTQAILEQSLLYLTGANNCGYGGTGMISVSEADSVGGPIGPPLASSYVCTSNYREVWYPVQWNIAVPPVFVVWIAWNEWGTADFLWTDHPAAGPTGPPAIGLCYPASRTPHTFVADAGQPLGPLNDGAGDVEFQWVANLTCPVHVENRTWGGIKALYR